MPDNTQLKTCSTCSTWNTEFRLAGKVASCASLGFSSEDSCKNWKEIVSAQNYVFIRVREPSLPEIMSQKDLRDSWKRFQRKIAVTTATYDNGYYYFFFSKDEEKEAEKFASVLSHDDYVKKSQGSVLPIKLANLEVEDRRAFMKIAESSRK